MSVDPKKKEFDEWVSKNERFKNLHKNQITIRRSTQESASYFRKQEIERYRHPTRPWIYYDEDGTQGIVAPVMKKYSGQQ